MILSLLISFLLTEGHIQLPQADGLFEVTHATGQVISQLPMAGDRDVAYVPRKRIIDGKQSLGVAVSAQSAVVIDVKSGNVLFQKNSDYKGSIASITKLMSALVFFDHTEDLGALITLTEHDERAGAQAHIYRGEALNGYDLLRVSLISSDNNSTIALARSTGLGLDGFVAEMNKKAMQLGLYDTHFVDPTGLEDGNVSTAFDVSRLIYHALQYDMLQEITSSSEYTLSIANSDKKRRLYNTDLLLDSYINTDYTITGGKTGYIPEAGYCLGIQVQDDQDHPIIVVAMGSKTDADRFQDVKALTQWTFDNFEWIKK